MEFITTLFPVINDCFNTYQNNKYHMKSVGEHIYNTFNNIDNVFHLKMTMLLQAKYILRQQIKTMLTISTIMPIFPGKSQK